MKNLLHLLFAFAFLPSCISDNNIIPKFNVMTNVVGGDTISIDMDLENAIVDGITIPSARQTLSGYFDLIIEMPKLEGNWYYKVYFQNESYKFSDTDDLAHENFYGSWEDTDIGFKPLTDEMTFDSIRIVGNPRNEKIYYGEDIRENALSAEKVEKVANTIRSKENWYQDIVRKAGENGVSVEKQLYADAQWVLRMARNEGETNNRWKRNPRAGLYSFMLVVCDDEGLQNIPEYVSDISKTNAEGNFVNPYGWFEKNKSIHIKVIKADRLLKTRAVISASRGVFVDKFISDRQNGIDTTSCGCGDSDELYKHALYEQFFSVISKQYTIHNVPLIHDVVGDDPYSRADYEKGRTMFDSTELLNEHPFFTDKPCQTVHLSDDSSYISIVNPHSTPDKMRKESTGIRSRIGFTYGKWRGKIKFPTMLNDDNVWNGLTYAFWLIYSDQHKWNNRRPNHVDGGYIDRMDGSPNPVRHADYYYSEIDIEIVKASKYWPVASYLHRKDSADFVEDATQNNDVMYCCTNWDLASHEPKKFSSGIDTIKFGDMSFETQRWTNIYKALTTRTPIPNSIFSEPFYYYEIEWKPTEIIWRLGLSPDNMRVVGYMNDFYTSIPNNQMKCVVTQEYHYSEWWPPIVFEQGLIPFNKTDIEGCVYEVVVE